MEKNNGIVNNKKSERIQWKKEHCDFFFNVSEVNVRILYFPINFGTDLHKKRYEWFWLFQHTLEYNIIQMFN